MNDGWIAVGRLRRAWGRRGELAGEIYSDKPERAAEFKQVVLELEGRRLEAGVERIWYHDGVPVFKFAGIGTISEAEQWEGADVYVAPEHRAKLEEGEYSHADLIGCAVVERGVTLGVVKAIGEYGGPPVLEVEREGGKEALIPFAREFCREIDVANKLIRVELPEGLLEL